MLYDEAGDSIKDFISVKKELYRSDLIKEEIIEKLNSYNIDERNFIVELLIEDKNGKFIDNVMETQRDLSIIWLALKLGKV